MQTVVALMTILAAAFVATECRSPPRPPPPTFDVCTRVLDRCFSSLEQNAFIAGQSTDYRLLIEDVNGICEAYQQGVTCITANLHNCEHIIRQRASVALAVGDFLCSDEGKSLLTQFKESQCYNEQSIIYELDNFERTCRSELNVDIFAGQGRCQALRDVFACAGNAVTWRCGEAAGRIYNGITNIKISATDCNAQSVGDLVEREIGRGFIRRQLDPFSRRKSGSGK